jgi:hypothetical protein
MEGSKTLSVNEYEATVAHARRLGSPAAQDGEGVRWAAFAPPVEELTDPKEPGFLAPSFRICDPEAYDLQMQKLLGIL